MKQTHGFRSRVAGLLGLLFLSGGCSLMPDDSEAASGGEARRTVKSIEDARVETREISSRVLDIVAVRGDVSEPGPGVDVCGDDPDSDVLYKMYHSWSVSGVARDVLEEGMGRARRDLPEEGWNIVEDGEKNNANRSPRILFEHDEVQYAINMTLFGSADDPLLSVSLVSGCFRTPEGETVKGQF
ncbi:hypothetical protein ACFVUW_22435 [Streptomyces xiamenensis]|uniref:hypothetical protein n=1 Tax=Streptomyces xiamenensis TaxID=408015 RepID=UPI0036E9CDA0